MMIDYREALQKELKDPVFKQAWDSYELEYHLANLLIKLRSEAGVSGKIKGMISGQRDEL